MKIMLMRFWVVLVLSVVTIAAQEGINEHAEYLQSKSNRIIDVSQRRTLGVLYQDIAQLKIISRKDTYRIGEFIDLRLALINKGKYPIFAYELMHPKIIVRSNGSKVAPYIALDLITVPEYFKVLEPNEFILDSFQLLVGCERRAFDQAGAVERSSLEVFEGGLFIDWGNACLSSTKAEKIKISAESGNRYVVLSVKNKLLKTAVGRIRSNTLEISVIE